MTLFIAILLLMYMEMPWWMYLIAVTIWLGHLGFHSLD